MAADTATAQAWQVPSWDEVVRQHNARVYRTAYRLTGNHSDAEDLTQETFVRVFRSLASFTPGSFEGWLHRITTNLFLDQVRKTSKMRTSPLGEGTERVVAPVDSSDPYRGFEYRNLTPQMRDALAALPRQYREAVLLRDVDDLSYEEIGTTLGISTGTVRSRIHRGRSLLRRSLSGREAPGAKSSSTVRRSAVT